MNAGEAPVIGMTDTYYAPGTYQLDVRPWTCPPWWHSADTVPRTLSGCPSVCRAITLWCSYDGLANSDRCPGERRT